MPTVVPVLSRWTEIGNINLENLPLTTWTAADNLSTPVIGGVTWLLNMPGGSGARVGGGTGLKTTAGSPTMEFRLSETQDMRSFRSLALTVAVSGGTVVLGSGNWLGMAWNNCWASLNGQVQRRTQTLGIDFWGTPAPARTAFCFHTTAAGVAAGYRNDALDIDDLPGPWETGWTWWHNAGIAGAPWPFTDAAHRPVLLHWGNGDHNYIERSARLWGC